MLKSKITFCTAQTYLIMIMSYCFTATTVSGEHRHKPINETRHNLDTNDTDASKTMPNSSLNDRWLADHHGGGAPGGV